MIIFANEPEDPILEIQRTRRENVKKYPTAQALAKYFETIPSVEEFLENCQGEKRHSEKQSACEICSAT